MTVLITLTVAGANTGPFNLYSNVDGFVSPFASGVSKAALLAGYTSTVVPLGTTTIRVVSFGECTNTIDISVITTTTTTTTTIFVPCECFEYDVIISELDTADATGNTGENAIYNNNIIINYRDCQGNPTESLSGTGTATVCADSNFPVTLSYFKDNEEALTIYSSVSQTETECCPL